MPDRRLREAYLDRLVGSMALPAQERRAAAEEIAAHIDEAIADMRSHGLPAEMAERRALERLGAPERLADDLTAARRQSVHALAAVGTALRVAILTGIQYLLFTWAAIIAVAITLSLGVAGVRRIVGINFLQADWTPLTDSFFPAVESSAVAYGIGRAILEPVAVAARRPAAKVRLPLAAAGAGITAWVALSVVIAPYHLAGALIMASAPAWFLLGLLRHRSRSAPILSSRLLVLTLAIFVIGGAGRAFLAGGSSSGVTSSESEVWHPDDEYAQIGPFAGADHPPLAFAEGQASFTGPGPGPVRLEREWAAPAGFLEAWSDVRLEVWPGPPGMLNGPALDAAATEPLATAPTTFDGRRLTGSVEFTPRPDREHYYLAITGVSGDGVRMQLAWPDVEWWHWEGTVADFLGALLRP